MGDEKKSYSGYNNIRGLIQDLAEKSDAIAHQVREQTIFAGTRPADAKTFMLISRKSRGLTELATAMQISRQAAHKSVQRLVAAQVVEFVYVEGSKRDMIAQLTEKGLEARRVGLEIAMKVEASIERVIGKADLENLRRILMLLKD